MKENAKTTDPYSAFENVLRRVLKISKTELDQRINAAKLDRKRRKEAKNASASRASGE